MGCYITVLVDVQVEVQTGEKMMEPSKRTRVDPGGQAYIQKTGRRTGYGSGDRQEYR